MMRMKKKKNREFRVTKKKKKKGNLKMGSRVLLNKIATRWFPEATLSKISNNFCMVSKNPQWTKNVAKICQMQEIYPNRLNLP